MEQMGVTNICQNLSVCVQRAGRQKKSPPLKCYLSINPITGFIEGSKKNAANTRRVNLLKEAKSGKIHSFLLKRVHV